MPTVPQIPLPKNDRWMLLDEVAALFGVSGETINRWVRQGKLKAYQPTARGNFYRKADVNKLLKVKGLPTI